MSTTNRPGHVGFSIPPGHCPIPSIPHRRMRHRHPAPNELFESSGGDAPHQPWTVVGPAYMCWRWWRSLPPPSGFPSVEVHGFGLRKKQPSTGTERSILERGPKKLSEQRGPYRESEKAVRKRIAKGGSGNEVRKSRPKKEDRLSRVLEPEKSDPLSLGMARDAPPPPHHGTVVGPVPTHGGRETGTSPLGSLLG
jgi:hypothetical protein